MNLYVSFGSLVSSHLIVALVFGVGGFIYGLHLGKKG